MILNKKMFSKKGNFFQNYNLIEKCRSQSIII